jgi:hypothetical protein
VLCAGNAVKYPDGVMRYEVQGNDAGPRTVERTMRITHYLKPKDIVDWIREQRVVENVFGSDPHAELMSRTAKTISFLAGEGALGTCMVPCCVVLCCGMGRACVEEREIDSGCVPHTG